METKLKKTILENIANKPALLELIIKGSMNRHEKYLSNLILSGNDVRVRAEKPWLYKSLTELGEEDFVTASNFEIRTSVDHPTGVRWHSAATKEYGYQVCHRLLYVDDEGLVLFVKDGEVFRPAKKGDTAYDFAKRLIAEEMVTSLELDKPATWADELFICAQNLAAYSAIWHEGGYLSDPLYSRRKRIKTEAVWHETLKQMGYEPFASSVIPEPETWSDLKLKTTHSSGNIDANIEGDLDTKMGDKAVTNRERTSYLNIIGAMLAQLTSGKANDTTVINQALSDYGVKQGISERKLQEVFAAAKRSLGAS